MLFENKNTCNYGMEVVVISAKACYCSSNFCFVFRGGLNTQANSVLALAALARTCSRHVATLSDDARRATRDATEYLGHGAFVFLVVCYTFSKGF